LDAEMRADTAGVQVRLQVIVIEIETDVAVEIAIEVIARVAFNGAPDLLGGFRIASQDGNIAPGAKNRGVDAEFGPRLRVEHCMGVAEKVANAGAAQQFIDALDVAALGEPDSLRPFAEMTLKFPRADFNLG